MKSFDGKKKHLRMSEYKVDLMENMERATVFTNIKRT